MDMERRKEKKRAARKRDHSSERHEHRSKHKKSSTRRRSKHRETKLSKKTEERRGHRKRRRHRTRSDSESSSSSSPSPSERQRRVQERPRTMVHYLSSRPKLLDKVFTCLSSTYIDRLLPEVFQGETLSVVRKRCSEQLEKLTDNEICLLINGKSIPLPSLQQDDDTGRKNHTVGKVSKTAVLDGDEQVEAKSADAMPSSAVEIDQEKSVSLGADDMIELMVTESDMLDEDNELKGALPRGKCTSTNPAAPKPRRVCSNTPSAAAADSTTSSQPQGSSISTACGEIGNINETSIVELELRHRALQAELRRESSSEKMRPLALATSPEDGESGIRLGVHSTKPGTTIAISPILLKRLPGAVSEGMANILGNDSMSDERILHPVLAAGSCSGGNSPDAVEEEEESEVETAIRLGLHSRTLLAAQPPVLSTPAVTRPSTLTTTKLARTNPLLKGPPSPPAPDQTTLDELRLRERALKSMIVAQAKQKKLI